MPSQLWLATTQASAACRIDAAFMSGTQRALPGSPLRGAGDPTHGSTVDIAGKPRPSPPDIGAYQN